MLSGDSCTHASLPGRKSKHINRRFNAKGSIMLKYMASTFPHPFSHILKKSGHLWKSPFRSKQISWNRDSWRRTPAPMAGFCLNWSAIAANRVSFRLGDRVKSWRCYTEPGCPRCDRENAISKLLSHSLIKWSSSNTSHYWTGLPSMSF